MPSSRSFAIAAALVVVALARVAHAGGGSAEASDHHRAGVAYAKGGKWEQAVREFDEAYKLDPTPLRLYDVGQVCLQAKQWVRARDAYAKVADSPALTTEQRDRASAGLAVAKSNVGRLKIAVDGAKASDVVTLDGAQVHADVVDVDPGKHVVRLVRDGEASEATVDVPPGVEMTASIGAVKKEEVQRPPPEDRGAGGGGVPAVAWIFTGVAVAAAGTGITLWVIADDEYAEVEASDCARTKTCEGRDEPARQKATIGDVLVVAGGVSAAVAAYFFVSALLEKPSKPPTSSRLDLSLTPGGGFVGLRARF